MTQHVPDLASPYLYLAVTLTNGKPFHILNEKGELESFTVLEARHLTDMRETIRRIGIKKRNDIHQLKVIPVKFDLQDVLADSVVLELRRKALIQSKNLRSDEIELLTPPA